MLQSKTGTVYINKIKISHKVNRLCSIVRCRFEQQIVFFLINNVFSYFFNDFTTTELCFVEFELSGDGCQSGIFGRLLLSTKTSSGKSGASYITLVVAEVHKL
jgi:hypothetical protein